MKNMIKNILPNFILLPIKKTNTILHRTKKKIDCIFQNSQSSYKKHNSQYEEKEALERHKKTYAEYEKLNILNSDENKLYKLFDQYPLVRNTAIDIGSGAGWFSAQFSKNFKKVIAMEPSSSAINIARQLFPKEEYSNIDWNTGFAETILPSINLSEPSFFFTGCVLSHLTDASTKEICKIIDAFATKGSILSFAECWGTESRSFMWHIRTQEWWKNALPSWKLDFHGSEIQNIPDRHKGFHGVKIK
jgi:hypothetical protein